MKLERLDDRVGRWDVALRAYLKNLEATKPVILTGDLNCAHLDLDNYCYFKPHVRKTPGCTPLERESFSEYFSSQWGFKDAFREVHGPVENAFTYFNTKVLRELALTALFLHPSHHLPVTSEGCLCMYVNGSLADAPKKV